MYYYYFYIYINADLQRNSTPPLLLMFRGAMAPRPLWFYTPALYLHFHHKDNTTCFDVFPLFLLLLLFIMNKVYITNMCNGH